MKIHILVHSKTGNTTRFADAIASRLMEAGHSVNITPLATVSPVKEGSVRAPQDIRFTNLPDISDCDLLMLGGPVWAFGPSPVIIAAVKQLGKLSGKTVVPFATMGFPFRCLGGNGALRAIAREAATRGAKIIPGGIARQMGGKLEGDIAVLSAEIAERIPRA